MKITLNAEQYKYFREVMAKFTCIHGVNYIAHEEMLKAFDLMEELHRDRFLIGKLKREAEAEWEKKKDYMLNNLPDAYYAYYVDFGNNIYRAVEGKLEYLTGTICENVKNGNRTPDDMLYARCITTRVMFVHAALSFHDYFSYYATKCGYNFSSGFGYADMTKMAQLIDKIVEKMRPRQKPHIWDSPMCVNAYDAIIDTMSKQGFFDDATHEAKIKNPQLSRKYIASTLASKFNVKS